MGLSDINLDLTTKCEGCGGYRHLFDMKWEKEKILCPDCVLATKPEIVEWLELLEDKEK